jgi:hypothetical protein
MGVEVSLMSNSALVAFAAASANSSDGIGLVGFLVIAGLALALVFLYRSLRRQLGRIDFDANGRSDAERMRRDASPDGDATP